MARYWVCQDLWELAGGYPRGEVPGAKPRRRGGFVEKQGGRVAGITSKGVTKCALFKSRLRGKMMGAGADACVQAKKNIRAKSLIIPVQLGGGDL